eukprot:TRINITY_DN6125_c0_g1_i5.p3 TRINITY_DN6125_c0_g1~~TRINITY_DN6125_c0_g1_i5.p3  ORF type:complete len:198 (+),score=42.36 TRINITY_DN6125_c0_g1_i5:806-1399(+)
MDNESVTHFCDICQAPISGPRAMHCLVCFDLDLCAQHASETFIDACKMHFPSHPMIPFRATASEASAKAALDPLLSQIFVVNNVSQVTCVSNNGGVDRTKVFNERKIKRFLLCISNWCVLFKRVVTFCSKMTEEDQRFIDVMVQDIGSNASTIEKLLVQLAGSIDKCVLELDLKHKQEMEWICKNQDQTNRRFRFHQ